MPSRSAPVPFPLRHPCRSFDTKGDAVKIDDWLLEILVCPKCHSPVRVDEEASELVCTGADCGLAYPVRDDIPVMLVDEARDPAKG